MERILDIVQIAISVLLIASILFQQRGAGLSSTFGGEGGVYFKKRGAEKILFVASIVLAGLFILSAIVRMVIS
jgi:protein translocase SecG subunit